MNRQEQAKYLRTLADTIEAANDKIPMEVSLTHENGVVTFDISGAYIMKPKKPKQNNMRKVIRLDEPKEECKKPIELTHYHRQMTVTETHKHFNFDNVDELIHLGYFEEFGDMFRLRFKNEDSLRLYSGHLNDGIY